MLADYISIDFNWWGFENPAKVSLDGWISYRSNGIAENLHRSYTKWVSCFLETTLDNQKLQHCFRLADAVTRGSDDKLYFAEPFVEQMTMAEFLSKLTSGAYKPSVSISVSYWMPPLLDSTHSEIYYLQSQNGNIYSSRYFKEDSLDSPSEFEPLRPDVPKDITWCTEAFGEWIATYIHLTFFRQS